MSLPQLHQLGKLLQSSNPRELRHTQEILTRVRALRGEMQNGHARDLAGCLDAAVLLLEYSVQLGCVGPEGIQRVVASLVNTVDDAFQAPAPAPAAPARAESGQPSGLRTLHAPSEVMELEIKKELRLGDVLVDMGAVTPEQVEMALTAQRATGMRIGEALVQMGATNWKQIEEAVQIQGRKNAGTAG